MSKISSAVLKALSIERKIELGLKKPDIRQERSKRYHNVLEEKFLNYNIDFESEVRVDSVRRWKVDYAINPTLSSEKILKSCSCLVEIEGFNPHAKQGHNSINRYLSDIEKYNFLSSIGFLLFRIPTTWFVIGNKDIELLLAKIKEL